MFCVRCKGAVKCQYLVDCEGCVLTRHSRGCRDLLRCSHCDGSVDCVGSAYLVDCRDLLDCTYCFGCVGLVGKDFHILNEPYDRDTYFRVTHALLAARRSAPLP